MKKTAKNPVPIMRSKVEQLNLMADRRKEIVMEEAPTIDKSKRKPKGQSII